MQTGIQKFDRFASSIRVIRNFVCLVPCITCFLGCGFKYAIRGYSDWYKSPLGNTIVSLSERIGGSIDSLERKEYGLFPKAANFDSAVIYQLGKQIPEGHDGYAVELFTTDGKKYCSVNRDPRGLAVLRAVVIDHDRRYAIAKVSTAHDYGMEVPFKTKWNIADYDDALGLPITGDEIKLFNKKRNLYFFTTACCLSSSLVGGTACLVWITDASINENQHDAEVYATMGGIIASGIIGGLVGNEMDKNETVKAIKAGRQLKHVE